MRTEHAEDLLTIVRALFCPLRAKNIFKPKVLAKVSRNDLGFIGSSIAVSAFLRPLCLHKRIISFKRRLQEAVVFAKALPSPSDDQGQVDKWSSIAYKRNFDEDTDTKEKVCYVKEKAPCKKCRDMFQGLTEFISGTNHESGDRETFRGACAEYCPVNKLITGDDVGQYSDPAGVQNKLRINQERCSSLFRGIEDLCEFANQPRPENGPGAELELRNEAERLRLVDKTQIFGFRPNVECGDVIV
ncbi:uncharacterized protein LOC114972794 [Acropora millepora]|uniref:uncharacterized protein LOC114972794 n=1 Tax=Acropora millepora TaxID=45264 RepID=UPI001CF345E7|nr:uncharacterized protein LOC114972794 [Acropora millepora]